MAAQANNEGSLQYRIKERSSLVANSTKGRLEERRAGQAPLVELELEWLGVVWCGVVWCGVVGLRDKPVHGPVKVSAHVCTLLCSELPHVLVQQIQAGLLSDGRQEVMDGPRCALRSTPPPH